MKKLFEFCKIALLSVLIGSLTLTAYAGQGHGNPGKGGNPGKAVKAHKVKSQGKHLASKKAFKANRFSTKDRTTISDFSKANSFFGSSLPPGIAMNVARGKPLPPGIEKRFLPDNLLSKLPARPGYDYLAVGDDVVLVDKTTGVIADILSNVLQ